MHFYLIFALIVLIGSYLLNLTAETLNLSRAKAAVPDDFLGYYRPQEYKKSQNYLKEKTKFSLVYSGTLTLAFILFIFGGIFNRIDLTARGFGFGLIGSGLLFALIIFLIFQFINLPFSCYQTFVIEQKYGFNRTSRQTFITDKLKGWAISLLMGGIILSFAIWFFDRFRVWGWAYCWLGLTLFELFLLFIWPKYIMPLFNKFEPIEEGVLKDKIEEYADSQDFKIQGIYKMDASRRSSKSNAFFAGIGKSKRIVLFDTLIENHTPEEIVAILAHEVGHYRKKHLIKMLLVSFFANGLMFYLLSLFIGDKNLSLAFNLEQASIYSGLLFFGFLYAPVNLFFSLFLNWFSRKNEKEADYFVVLTTDLAAQFIQALKKLTVKNLSNLTPHPLKVALSYSHPPVLSRIADIRFVQAQRVKPKKA